MFCDIQRTGLIADILYTLWSRCEMARRHRHKRSTEQTRPILKHKRCKITDEKYTVLLEPQGCLVYRVAKQICEGGI